MTTTTSPAARTAVEIGEEITARLAAGATAYDPEVAALYREYQAAPLGL